MPIPEGLDPSLFEERVVVAAVRVHCKDCSRIVKHQHLKKWIFRRRQLRNVVQCPLDPQKRLVLLAEELPAEKPAEGLPAEGWAFLEAECAAGRCEIVTHEVVIGYEHLPTEVVLAKLLPSGVEVPSSFETVGHIAHFNLRKELEPFKFLIGQVVLDKNRGLRTIVNKTSSLKNEFRTLDMEVIAGEDSTLTTVKEQGMTFDLDYRDVYWNSRLSTERQRVCMLLGCDSIVADMFAGAGAMSCFAARKGCTVYSNDLNPRGAHWQQVNADGNGCKNMTVFNMDAREFIRRLGREQGLFSSSRQRPLHCIMNLPELALDFLDVFRGITSEDCGPVRIHCYCFARYSPPAPEIHPRIEACLGVVPEGVKIVDVRDVAPNKIMYCVEFTVPPEVLKDDGPEAKRRRVDVV